MATQDEVKEQLKQQMAGNVNTAPSVLARASQAEVAAALRGFAVLVAANFQALRALKVLAKNTAHANLSAVFDQVASSVEQGNTLSKSMARFPWYFDSVCIAIIRAAEESSTLERGLDHVADMMEIEQEVREKVASALAYPMVLSTLGIIVVWSLLTFVVPTFAQQVHDAQGHMEGMAAVVLSVSNFVRNPLGVLAIFAVVAGLVFSAARAIQRSNKTPTMLVARLPVFGALVRTATATQFANMLGLMASSGVPLATALDLARGAFAETHLAAATASMYAAVDSGRSLSEATRNAAVFDPLVTDMISIGEESGKLGDMLAYVAKTLRHQLLRSAGRIELLLQPILLIIMGAMVLMIFLSFFVPYFEVLSKLSMQPR